MVTKVCVIEASEQEEASNWSLFWCWRWINGSPKVVDYDGTMIGAIEGYSGGSSLVLAAASLATTRLAPASLVNLLLVQRGYSLIAIISKETLPFSTKFSFFGSAPDIVSSVTPPSDLLQRINIFNYTQSESYLIAMPCEVMSARLRRSCCPNSALVDGARSLVVDAPGLCHYVAVDDVWVRIQDEARGDAEEEPLLRKLYCDLVLAHPTLESALAAHLAAKLAVPVLVPHAAIHDLLLSAFSGDAGILRAVRADLRAVIIRDPACAKMMVHCFLYYKGFLALQTHRVAHRLWAEGRRGAALLLQSRSSEVFAVDIHPGARIGAGVLLDHATGVVIGETAVVGNGVSLLHAVTLGGTGKEGGDQHPKISDGVLVGAGTQILGNVTVAEGAQIGAGSVVLKAVPPRTTAVGNPARLIAGKENPVRREKRAALTMDHTSWFEHGPV
ncbi:probable serine acetyltransferase 3 [Zingiber officinale]|nr:probable serine acetyltransferase 3 [Zingiber officinale]